MPKPPSQMDSLPSSFLTTTILLSIFISLSSAQSHLCRTSCGVIPIRYPFGIDDGCGSPYYRRMLVCTNSSRLILRTPSGNYPVAAIDYADPHLLVTDPSMWSCPSNNNFYGDADDDEEENAVFRRPVTPFSLDTSTRFSLSPRNDYLFFNCSEDSVIIQPKPSFCDRFPDRCDSACDSAGYLCRNLPVCPNALVETRTSCCSYYPKASESLRLMLKHCASYTSVYWRTVGASFPPYDQVPEYGIRVDFEIPVTTRCLHCRDRARGRGACGFDTESRSFLCLCDEGNVTTYCTDGDSSRHKVSAGVIAGTTVFSIGAVGVGALVWYLRKMRKNKIVTCGVQSNENRLF